MLENWKKLPAYRLETRIDSLFGFAVPKLIENIYGYQTKIVIPELPIRLATIHPEHENTNFANRSYKVDFYVRTENKKNLFIEFKSDSGSRRENQDDYLMLSQKFGMKAIIEGILKLYSATSYRSKYKYLLDKLIGANIINNDHEILIGNENIQVIYAQPKSLKGDKNTKVLDFQTIADELISCYPDEKLMTCFASSLKNWAND